MPWPKQKRSTPKPELVVIRHADQDDPVEVVSHEELVRRKEEHEWQEYARRTGLDLRDEHARLALHDGDVITVPGYTRDLWWFVCDVDGIDRQITARTFVFEQPRERTFPFDLVEPRPLWHIAERNEAASHHQRLVHHFGQSRRVGRASRTRSAA